MLEFPVEGDCRTAGAIVNQRRSGHGFCAMTTRIPQRVRAQLMRRLSPDADGRRFLSLAEHDAVVAELQRRYSGLPGLRSDTAR